MTTETAKEFVLLCIDNEIYRYKEIEKIYYEDVKIQIKTLQEFRRNIEYNL